MRLLTMTGKSFVWEKRFMRFWLVVLLPIALWFGYKAFESHHYMTAWREAAEEARIGLYNAKSPVIEETARELLSAAQTGESRTANAMNSNIVIALILAFLPGIVYVLSVISYWIWTGKKVVP